MVSLPTYDNNQFARGISNKDYAKLVNNPDKPLTNHAVKAHYPPGSTYKLVAGTGALADRKITPTTRVQTRPLPDARVDASSTTGTNAGSGACNIYCGFGHSSDTFFFQLAGMLGIDRLGYWAKQYGFGSPTGIDLPDEVAGIVPTNQWKLDVLGEPIFPGETYQAGIGQGYDVVTPIQLINAYAALANGGKLYQPQIVRDIVGPDGIRGPRRSSRSLIRKMERRPSVLRDDARSGPQHRRHVRHTYNLVDLPIKVAGKSGTAEFGTRDSKGRLPSTPGSSASCPRTPRRGNLRRARTRSSSCSPSPTTRGRRATPPPRS